MSGPESIDWDLYGTEFRHVYQLKHKIGFKPIFFHLEPWDNQIIGYPFASLQIDSKF